MEENKNIHESIRKAMEITDEDKNFIRTICEEFNVSEFEATNRVQMIKRFSLVNAPKMKHDNLVSVIDLIASGKIIPTDTLFDFDQPLSAYLTMFETKENEVDKERKNGLVMNVSVNFFGNKFSVSIARDKNEDRA